MLVSRSSSCWTFYLAIDKKKVYKAKGSSDGVSVGSPFLGIDMCRIHTTPLFLTWETPTWKWQWFIFLLNPKNKNISKKEIGWLVSRAVLTSVCKISRRINSPEFCKSQTLITQDYFLGGDVAWLYWSTIFRRLFASVDTVQNQTHRARVVSAKWPFSLLFFNNNNNNSNKKTKIVAPKIRLRHY